MLLVTKRFYPGIKAGGPQTSLLTFCNFISSKNYKEINVVTLDRDVGDSQPYNFVKKNKRIKLFKFAKVNYLPENSKIRTIFCLIKSYNNNNLIIVNSFFDPIFGALIPTIISIFKRKTIYCFVRGELQKNSLSIKSQKKKIFIDLFGNLFSRKIIYIFSDENEYNNSLESLSTIKNYRIAPNLPQVNKQINMILPSNDSIKLIYLGRIRLDKNLFFFLQVLSKQTKKIDLDIYGPVSDKTYWSKCQDLITNLDNNISIRYKGILKRNGLSDVCHNYHFLVNPSLSENYGHSIAESLGCGLPTIVTVGTPWMNLEDHNLGFTLGVDITEWESFFKDLSLIDYNSKYKRQSVSKAFHLYPLVSKSEVFNQQLFEEIIRYI